ncbi:hypothetical protein BCV70DRAFT_223429 [Testicularia cyperi]|uniref:Uncharacterized protein n=1 Tax=Testicularia cyperi TaxID=1882483 RepID=A0A317XSA5_9BASI|nr:hypothetical protein BCV70DRAFT_223429 [Testicularia cyperi]
MRFPSAATFALSMLIAHAVTGMTLRRYRRFYEQVTDGYDLPGDPQGLGAVLNDHIPVDAYQLLDLLRTEHTAFDNGEKYKNSKSSLENLRLQVRHNIRTYLQPDNIVNQLANNLGVHYTEYSNIDLLYNSNQWAKWHLSTYAGHDPTQRTAKNLFKNIAVYLELLDKGRDLARVEP